MLLEDQASIAFTAIVETIPQESPAKYIAQEMNTNPETNALFHVLGLSHVPQIMLLLIGSKPPFPDPPLFLLSDRSARM